MTSIARRAPFSDNPRVGQRGLRTRERILVAALQEFAAHGYAATSVERIAKRAGCSRVTMYQYFASKEEVFSHLAAQVGRQVDASVEAVDLVNPDRTGWDTLRTLVQRQADIFERYLGVFHAYESAAEAAPVVAMGGATSLEASVGLLRAKLNHPTMPPRLLDAALPVLYAATVRTFYLLEILRRPEAGEPESREQALDALTDVLHRSLFGLQPGLNTRGDEGPAGAQNLSLPRPQASARNEDDSAARRALLDSARQVFAQRGFSGTRVDDVAEAAGLSHGAFYRHFRNKADLIGVLVREAALPLGQAVNTAPAPAPGSRTPAQADLRRWVRGCHATHRENSPILHVWLDAALHEPTLVAETATALGWARCRMTDFLAPRSFGNRSAESLVLLALLDVQGAHFRTSFEIDAVASIVERGFFGQTKR